MSTPINPSNIMIYKIVRDYEKDGQTIHTMEELFDFSNSVLEYTNSVSTNQFWILNTIEIKEDLARICDVTTSICEFNPDKYSNGGEKFATTMIGALPYLFLKGAIQERKKESEKTLKLTKNNTQKPTLI